MEAAEGTSDLQKRLDAAPKYAWLLLKTLADEQATGAGPSGKGAAATSTPNATTKSSMPAGTARPSVVSVDMALFEAMPSSLRPNISVTAKRAKIPRGPRITWLNRVISLYFEYLGKKHLGLTTKAALLQEIKFNAPFCRCCIQAAQAHELHAFGASANPTLYQNMLMRQQPTLQHVPTDALRALCRYYNVALPSELAQAEPGSSTPAAAQPQSATNNAAAEPCLQHEQHSAVGSQRTEDAAVPRQAESHATQDDIFCAQHPLQAHVDADADQIADQVDALFGEPESEGVSDAALAAAERASQRVAALDDAAGAPTGLHLADQTVDITTANTAHEATCHIESDTQDADQAVDASAARVESDNAEAPLCPLAHAAEQGRETQAAEQEVDAFEEFLRQKRRVEAAAKHQRRAHKHERHAQHTDHNNGARPSKAGRPAADADRSRQSGVHNHQAHQADASKAAPPAVASSADVRLQVQLFVGKLLAPLLDRKHITLAQYTEILARAVEKILKAHGDAADCAFLDQDSRKICRLVDKYVEHVRQQTQ